MTHKYNTRFQAKKIAAAPKMEMFTLPSTLSNTIFHNWHSLDQQKEYMLIKSLLSSSNETNCRVKRIEIAIELFHYMEHQQTLMNDYPKFRNAVVLKAQEFIRIAEEERAILNANEGLYRDNFLKYEDVKKQIKMVTLMDHLSSVANRILTMANTQ